MEFWEMPLCCNAYICCACFPWQCRESLSAFPATANQRSNACSAELSAGKGMLHFLTKDLHGRPRPASSYLIAPEQLAALGTQEQRELLQQARQAVPVSERSELPGLLGCVPLVLRCGPQQRRLSLKTVFHAWLPGLAQALSPTPLP